MCILFIYSNPQAEPDEYRLVIASNRDEFYHRPAQGAFECQETGIIGGRDMESGREGGMWLGIRTNVSEKSALKFAALLNVTGYTKKAIKGRGFIVRNYLESTCSAEEYVDLLKTQDEDFSAYNLVTVEIRNDGQVRVRHHSNCVPDGDAEFNTPGSFAFGNSTIEAPLQKVLDGRDTFESIMISHKNVDGRVKLIDDLTSLLRSEDTHLPDNELERRAPNAVRSLSSIFVRIPQGGYGTRTHSMVLVDGSGKMDFVEMTMEAPIDPTNPMWKRTAFCARITTTIKDE